MDTEHFENAADIGATANATPSAEAWRPTTVVVDERATGVPELRVTGDIDMFAEQVLQNAITDALSRAPAVAIVDLSDVRFLDSAGIAALVTAQVRHPATNLRIVAGSAFTLRPIQLAGLEDVLDIYPTLQSARHISPQQ